MVEDINKIFMKSYETICMSVTSFETPTTGEREGVAETNAHTARALSWSGKPQGTESLKLYYR